MENVTSAILIYMKQAVILRPSLWYRKVMGLSTLFCKMHYQATFVLLIAVFISCVGASSENKKPLPGIKTATATARLYDTSQKVIHVLVALCDNKYQGIVPVPVKIGNGQNPGNNLYWGCAYGVRSYFKKSSDWKLIKSLPADGIKMERLVFKHVSKNIYLVADAYNGMNIKDCTIDFLKSCSGQLKNIITVNGKSIGINGNASLLAYVGHDGLMDFTLNESFKNTDGKQRDAIMLACISKNYFAPLLYQTKANPLVWSTGLMSPEAYILHDALHAYINGQPPANIRNAAAKAYAKYQKCSEKAAMKLLVTGY